MSQYFIGLMSGTSIDSIDAVLMNLSAEPALLTYHSEPIPAEIKREILALCLPGDNEIERLGRLDRQLGQLFATAVEQLLRKGDLSATQITAIGSHGQTVRHRPAQRQSTAFTLQIGDPNTIAELTGITTVADFRRRDIAAGGEGAPLVPAFHHALFASRNKARAIVNIGGMANLSYLGTDGSLIGFDTGPGNCLIDSWIQRCRGESFDADGHWAAQGKCQPALLEALLAHPYFKRPPPKSTGREAFHLDYVLAALAAGGEISDRDVQTTLTHVSAASIAAGICQIDRPVTEIYLCGGGTHNRTLCDLISHYLQHDGISAPIDHTDALGLPADWVEAAAFAWLAQRTLARQCGNAPSVTAASGERILGGIYPAFRQHGDA